LLASLFIKLFSFTNDYCYLLFIWQIYFIPGINVTF